MKLNKLLSNEKVSYKTLEQLFDIKNGYTPSKNNPDFWTNGNILWFKMHDLKSNGAILNDSIIKTTQLAIKKSGLYKANSIILATTATIGVHALITEEFLCNQQFTVFQIKKEYEKQISIKFYYHYFYIIDEWCKNNTKISAFPAVDIQQLRKLKVPFPSLELQQEIAEVLDKFSELTAELTAELQLRKEQYEYYLNNIFNFNDVEHKNLDQIVELKTTSKSITKKDYILDGEYDVITSSIKPSGKYNQYNQDENQITITKDGTCGFVTWQYKKFWLAAGSFIVKPREDFKINMKYLFYFLKNSQNEIENMKVGSPIAHLYKKHLYQLKIPIPPLEKQNQIVKILDTFSTLINDLEQGIPAEIKLRQQQYEYYRNLLLTFTEDENDKRA